MESEDRSSSNRKRKKTQNVCEKVAERLPFGQFLRRRCPLKAGMTSLADLFIAFLSPIRLGDIHESGGERVVGDECVQFFN